MSREPCRRSFVIGAGGVLLHSALATAGDKKVLALPLQRVPPLKKVGGSARIVLKERPIILIRDSEKSVRAFDATCTHKDCLVTYDSGEERMQCDCHASAFDLNGTVRGGPAPASLPRHPAKLRGDEILIKL